MSAPKRKPRPRTTRAPVPTPKGVVMQVRYIEAGVLLCSAALVCFYAHDWLMSNARSSINAGLVRIGVAFA